MKRKILVGLVCVSVGFVLLGVYLVFTIEQATTTLNNLVELHRVEILRKQLLVQIREVQGDLTTKDTPYARTADMVVARAIEMHKMGARCRDCHHTPEVNLRLDDMAAQMEAYKASLSRVLTTVAGEERLQAQMDAAFRSGEVLIAKVDNIVALTSANLRRHTEAVLSRIAVTKNILILLIAVGPLVTTLAFFLLFRQATTPVQTLLDATRRLKAGELDYRVGEMKDEFGELAAAFNEMAASLNDQMLKMQRTDQLAVAGELAAGLAHEIKNPLAGIKAGLTIIQEESSILEEEDDIVPRVVDEVTRLEALMKSFLNFAKPPQPQWTAVDVNGLVGAALGLHLRQHLSGAGKDADIHIVEDFDEGVPEIEADPVQLRQVLLNLCLNAIDAMGRKGTVFLETRFEPESHTVQIRVRDTGPGLDAATRERIFEPFFTTKSKGTGLGLAICRMTIEKQGGTISAHNHPEGGAVFQIDLPVRMTEESPT